MAVKYYSYSTPMFFWIINRKYLQPVLRVLKSFLYPKLNYTTETESKGE